MILFADFDEALVQVEEDNQFLPFVRGEAARIELKALAVKKCLGEPVDAIVDPWAAAERVEVRVLGGAYLKRFPKDVQEATLQLGATRWSAGTVLAGSTATIVLNPVHDIRRQRATLAEELVHLVMGHPPSLIYGSTGMRTYNDDVESEAYGVGGALLLPYADLFRLTKRGISEARIAGMFDVSSRFVAYRINRTGLRRMYRKRSG